jgi:hypothetical protein
MIPLLYLGRPREMRAEDPFLDAVQVGCVAALENREFHGCSAGPVGAEELCLGEDGLGGFFLLVGRVAVLAEDAFDGDADLGADGFALGLVNGDGVADALHQLVGDGFEGWLPSESRPGQSSS